MPEYTVTYFPVYARGEPTRMILAHAKADWEDKIVSGDSWKELKPSVPGGQIPALTLADGKMIVQSVAMARFVAKKFGYYPTDDVQALEVDMIIDSTYCDKDVFMKIMGPNFAKEEEKEAKIKAAFEEGLPALLKVIDPYLGDGWLVGDKLSLADFFIGATYVNCMTNPKARFGVEDGKWKAWLEANPKFDAYGKRFAAELKDYLDNRFEATL